MGGRKLATDAALAVRRTQGGKDSIGGRDSCLYGQLITITIGPASGIAKWVEMNFEGAFTGETGVGTWEKVGHAKWKYRGINRYSNGSVTAHRFEWDLAKRTWTGKHYEWN